MPRGATACELLREDRCLAEQLKLIRSVESAEQTADVVADPSSQTQSNVPPGRGQAVSGSSRQLADFRLGRIAALLVEGLGVIDGLEDERRSPQPGCLAARWIDRGFVRLCASH